MLRESFQGSGIWPISYEGDGEQYTPPHVPLAMGTQCTRKMMSFLKKMSNKYLGSQEITSMEVWT